MQGTVPIVVEAASISPMFKEDFYIIIVQILNSQMYGTIPFLEAA
jgi:hypothetical protein